MIVVDLATLFVWHIAVVLVVAIHAEHHAVFAERLVNSSCESGFAASRSACYAYDDTAHVFLLTNTSLWLPARLFS